MNWQDSEEVAYKVNMTTYCPAAPFSKGAHHFGPIVQEDQVQGYVSARCMVDLHFAGEVGRCPCGQPLLRSSRVSKL